MAPDSETEFNWPNCGSETHCANLKFPSNTGLRKIVTNLTKMPRKTIFICKQTEKEICNSLEKRSDNSER